MIDSFLLSQCVSLIKEFSERTIYINYAKIFFQVYDMYGEEGLKGGMGGGGGGAPHEHFNPGGGNSYTYSYHGDPRATFAEFFGTSNPFASFFNNHDIFNQDGVGGGGGSDSLHASFHNDPFSENPFASLGGLHGGLHSPGSGVGLGRTPFR